MNPLLVVAPVVMGVMAMVGAIGGDKNKPPAQPPVEKPPVEVPTQEPTTSAVVIDFMAARERILDRRY